MVTYVTIGASSSPFAITQNLAKCYACLFKSKSTLENAHKAISKFPAHVHKIPVHGLNFRKLFLSPENLNKQKNLILSNSTVHD